MPTEMHPLSVVLIEEDGYWSAQCLEIDLAAQAKSLEDVVYEIQRTMVVHVAACKAHGKDPFAIPAPPEFWQMFTGSKLVIRGDRVPFSPPSPAYETEVRVATPRHMAAAVACA